MKESPQAPEHIPANPDPAADKRPSLERAVIDLSKRRPSSGNWTAYEARLNLLRSLSPPHCKKLRAIEEQAQKNVQRLMEQEKKRKQKAEEVLQERIRAREEALKETEKTVLEIIDDIQFCIEQNDIFAILYEDKESLNAFISYRDELLSFSDKTYLHCHQDALKYLGIANALINRTKLMNAIKRSVRSNHLTENTLAWVQRKLTQLTHQNKANDEYIHTFIESTEKSLHPLEKKIEDELLRRAVHTPLPSPQKADPCTDKTPFLIESLKRYVERDPRTSTFQQHELNELNAIITALNSSNTDKTSELKKLIKRGEQILKYRESITELIKSIQSGRRSLRTQIKQNAHAQTVMRKSPTMLAPNVRKKLQGILNTVRQRKRDLEAAQAELDEASNESLSNEKKETLAEQLAVQEQIAKKKADAENKQRQYIKGNALAASARSELSHYKQKHLTGSTAALTVGSVLAVAGLGAGIVWLAATFSSASNTIIQFFTNSFPAAANVIAADPKLIPILLVSVLVLSITLLGIGGSMRHCSKQSVFSEIPSAHENKKHCNQPLTTPAVNLDQN